MSLRNAMRKAAGLLVELPPEEPEAPSASPLSADDLPDLELPDNARLGTAPYNSTPKTIEEIVREADGPDLDQVKVDEAQLTAPTSSFVSGNNIDFAAIYRAANLPPAPFAAEQMLETLASLPADLPLETRRLTVRAMMSTLGKTMGATPESVVADASRKLAALNSFASFMERKTGESVTTLEQEIAALEAQVDAKRTAILAAKAELAKVNQGCEAESDRLDDVLEFFSLDVYPSKHSPPGTPSAAETPEGATNEA